MQIPFILLTWLIFIFLRSPILMPIFILAQASVFCLFTSFGNINSVMAPLPVEREGRMLSRNSADYFSRFSYILIFITLFLSFILAAVIWKLKSSLLSYLIIGTITVLTYGFYHRSKSKASKILLERYEAIYNTLRKT